MRSKLSGRKISRLFRPVKRSVLEGGVGWTSGGRLERSSVRLDLREAEEDDLEGRGEGSMICEVVMDAEFEIERVRAKLYGVAVKKSRKGMIMRLSALCDNVVQKDVLLVE